MDRYVQLLETLGYSKDELAAIADEKKDFKADEFANKRTEAIKAILRTDNTLRDEIRGEEKGKIYGEVYRKVGKEFGLSESDYKDKPIDDVLKVSKSRFEESIKKAANATDSEAKKELERVQAELTKVRNEEIPAIEGKYKQEFESYRIGSVIDYKISKLDLATKPEIVKPYIKERLGNFQFKLNENGEVDVYDKEGKSRARKNNNFVSVDDILKEIATEGELLKKSNGFTGGGDGGGTKPTQSDYEKYMSNPNITTEAKARWAKANGYA